MLIETLTAILITSATAPVCEPTHLACSAGNEIHMHERPMFSGQWRIDIDIKLVDYADLPNHCGGIFTGTMACMVDGVLITADWHLCSPYLADVGAAVAAAHGIPLAWNDRYTLGHELWHVLGRTGRGRCD